MGMEDAVMEEGVVRGEEGMEVGERGEEVVEEVEGVR